MRIANHFTKSLLASSVGLGALCMSGTAWAQQSTDTAPQAQDDADDGFDDNFDDNVIIVTASKRETTLQELPVSVSVTSGDTIEQAQIRDILDLQTVAPSLRVSQLQSSTNTTFIIRGFGNGANNIGVEPSVGVFIDGVFRSRSAGQIGDLANVARVEVLRGPQSTLFGKNASAGVISVVTREPQFEFGGSVEATYGNFNQVVLKADITGPITDTLAFSVDGGYNRRDGFFDIVNLDEEINDRDRFNARGQLLFEPNDDLKFRFIADYSRLDEVCCFAGNLVAGPTVPALAAVNGGQPALDAENLFAGNAFSNIVPENVVESYGASLQSDWSTGAINVTSITSYRRLEAFEQNDIDFSAADVANEIADQTIETFTSELRIASDFDGPFNFLLGGFYFDEDISETSQITTGEDIRTFFELLTPTGPGTFGGVEAALGLTPGSIFTGGLTDEAFSLNNRSFSIFGTVDFEVTDRLTLSAGFNYTDDEKDFAINITALDSLANINLVDAVIVGQLIPFLGADATNPAAIAAFAADPATAPIFGAISAAATDPTQNPLLGLQPFQFQPPFVNVPNSVENARTSDTDLSYTLRASYEVTDNINVYVTYATGFKASSINLSRDSRPTAADFTPGPFGSTILAPPSNILNAGLAVPNLGTGGRIAGPEDAEVYEAGLKAQFDRVGFNVAVFEQILDGFQSNIFTGTGFALNNAGEQTTFGIEFDTTVNPVDPLVLTLALTYLDANFDSFVGSPVGDLSGEQVGGVSPISLATSATYTHEFGSGAQLIGRVDYSYESNVAINNGLPTFNAALGNTQLFRREVNLVNGAITLRLENGLEFSAFARNLLDERFITTVFDGVAQAGTVSGYPNAPRTYGGTIRFKF
ncbi:TonB-dependent receptor [Parasphingorhabdus sp. DH2-15]|uniref:TonB-dependent receptor n=1 Tax=Parasphingorhabdus sp. DH2-15 TaxID=3444112 RepID=UPI003F68712A